MGTRFSVLESSTVLDDLLRFCYPTSPPELGDIATVCDILDAARKYMMDPIADYLLRHFVSRAEKGNHSRCTLWRHLVG